MRQNGCRRIIFPQIEAGAQEQIANRRGQSTQWYALRSKPNKEMAPCREARARGYEVFCPQIRIQPVNPWSRRIRPYFSDYLCFRAGLAPTGCFAPVWMLYSQGPVSFDTEPSSVPEALIAAIRRRVGVINVVGGEIFDQLRVADAVTIQGGPFERYQAIFDARLPGSERVLLRLLGKRKNSAEALCEADPAQESPLGNVW